MVFGFPKLAPQNFYDRTVSTLPYYLHGEWITKSNMEIQKHISPGSTPIHSLFLPQTAFLGFGTALPERRTWLDSLRLGLLVNFLYLQRKTMSTSKQEPVSTSQQLFKKLFLMWSELRGKDFSHSITHFFIQSIMGPFVYQPLDM